ncbi:MAG: pirin family protein [Myxococcales bacterium]|nr:pirin family protein [Myxococcales bacterium]
MEPDLVLTAPKRDLGDGFVVRRALPAPQRRMVSWFTFLDQMGPVTMAPGQGLDVRPHPHIGLATVTFLFEGAILHRDTLGNVQRIEPGAVNWMTAGRGIAHSERTPEDVRASGGRVFGIQLWVALPRALEETAPTFEHTPASALPEVETGVRLVLGEAYGARSPVKISSAMFYVAAALKAGASLKLPDARERAVYVAQGSLHGAVDGQLLVFGAGEVVLEAATDARILVMGGEPADGPRQMWWNFVHSSHERIEVAKADWRAGRFGQIPGEHEFIPLPDDPPPPVRYP